MPSTITPAAFDGPIPTESRGGKTGSGYKRKTKRPLPPINRALARLEESAGGREHFLGALQGIDGLTKEEETLITLLAHPSYKTYGLARLCVIAKISAAEAIRLFTKAKGAQAYQVAINKVYDKLPEVAADVVARSLPHTDPCPLCQGDVPSPTDPDPKVCSKCRGKGVIHKIPSIKHQEWTLQMGDLLKQDSGVTINNNQLQIAAGQGQVRTSSDFRAATDRLLFPGRSRLALPEGVPNEVGVVEEAELVPSIIKEPV